MKAAKRAFALFLAVLLTAAWLPTVYAQDDTPALRSLDTSAVNGWLVAYLGVETYFVVYPEPEEAESLFDIRDAEITCSKEGVVTAVPDKNEEYRYGSVLITGQKLGLTTVTVTEPQSGVSCSVKVLVIPAFGYYFQNFLVFLDYLPYFLFWRIVHLFGK